MKHHGNDLFPKFHEPDGIFHLLDIGKALI